MVSKLVVFDFDGTITHPGNDLFFSCFNDILDKNQFESINKIVKKNGNGFNSAQSVLELCRTYLNLRGAGWDSELRTLGYKKMSILIKNGLYYKQALKVINDSATKHGHVVLISTANIRFIAEGAMSALKDRSLLEVESVKLISSEICSKGVTRVNAGVGKGVYLREWMKMNILGSPDSIDVYCDDPHGTDAGLIELADKTFVVPECFV
ncbi:hypothetical protein LMJ53_15835 [Rheinheimera sp. UJ51]|uniref:haloacid dehalogenase-like hydrolase n=1 Tax=unclassified Rheinheimera TaxID=115860 RepID=UPI001E5F49A3|nr:MULTISPECIES: haloacid dehalogenase-like hydrolase [unclassified Rheinheimera]MCC5453190.1 hypothetical protein [Rheinheimera sp. UJ51]MCF4010866.1 hypothetical protein [Rheinheimera sp. UJ63]